VYEKYEKLLIGDKQTHNKAGKVIFMALGQNKIVKELKKRCSTENAFIFVNKISDISLKKEKFKYLK